MNAGRPMMEKTAQPFTWRASTADGGPLEGAGVASWVPGRVPTDDERMRGAFWAATASAARHGADMRRMVRVKLEEHPAR